MCNKKEGREYLEKLLTNSLLLKHLITAADCFAPYSNGTIIERVVAVT
jgi:hypothetical protein